MKHQVRRWLSQNWLVVGVIVAIPLAALKPQFGARGGPLRPEITVRYVAVVVIFFLSGLGLKPRQILSAVTNVRLHVLVQTFTLLVVPLTMSRMAPLLRPVLNRWLVDGLVAVACMPPPVSSAVILTRAVGGNDAAAIFNAALGSLLGVVVTPLLLATALEGKRSFMLTTIGELATTILAPLALGQIFRPFLEPPNGLGQGILLLIIYTTFCDSFVSAPQTDNVKAGLVAIIAIVLVLQIFLLLLVFHIANKFFDPPDVVCALFSATHKSLTLGIPVLRVVFDGHPYLPLLSAPLLVYHPVQICLGGLLVPSLRAWMGAKGQTVISPRLSIDV